MENKKLHFTFGQLGLVAACAVLVVGLTVFKKQTQVQTVPRTSVQNPGSYEKLWVDAVGSQQDTLKRLSQDQFQETAQVAGAATSSPLGPREY